MEAYIQQYGLQFTVHMVYNVYIQYSDVQWTMGQICSEYVRRKPNEFHTGILDNSALNQITAAVWQGMHPDTHVSPRGSHR